MTKISVITPTVRRDNYYALSLIEKSLKQQTFQDFQWVVQDQEEEKGNKVWTLNRDYNNAIKKAQGELIISWQDFTYAKPDTLERFWNHYQEDPKALVSAVGHKYSDDSWTVTTWQDPRMRDDQGSYYDVNWNDLEWNLLSVPKEALYAVGGFMEDLDERYGLDGFCVLERLHERGEHKFKLDQSIKSYSLEHDRLPDWKEKNWIQNNSLKLYEAKREELRQEGKWPVASYLQPLE